MPSSTSSPCMPGLGGRPRRGTRRGRGEARDARLAHRHRAVGGQHRGRRARLQAQLRRQPRRHRDLGRAGVEQQAHRMAVDLAQAGSARRGCAAAPARWRRGRPRDYGWGPRGARARRRSSPSPARERRASPAGPACGRCGGCRRRVCSSRSFLRSHGDNPAFADDSTATGRFLQLAIRKPPFDDTAIRPAALSEADISRPHSDDAAVPPDQAAASGHPALLPHGRLLRALLRRRREGRAPARHHAHHARPVERQADPHGGRALPRGRAIPRPPGQARRIGGDRRAGGRAGRHQGADGARGEPHRHPRHADRRRAARRPPRRAAARRQPAPRRARAGLAEPRQRRLPPHAVPLGRAAGPVRAPAPGRGAGARRARPAACSTRSPPRSAGWPTGSSTPRPARACSPPTSAPATSPASASRTCRWRSAPPRPCTTTPRPPSARRSPTSPASSSSANPRPCAWTPPPGATWSSPRPCAASPRPPCCRCSTPASPAWARAGCAMPCTTRCATAPSPPRAMPRWRSWWARPKRT